MFRTVKCIALTFTFTAFFAALGSTSDAQGLEVALERKVFDAERGVRATITYRPEVPTGETSEIVNSDGSVTTLHWDSFMGQFTAEITEGTMTNPDSEAFLKEAVILVCPTVDHARLEKEWIQFDGPFLRIFAQCPKIDKARE